MLDCTLRDGGWVNQFAFGAELMQSVFDAVEGSGIEYVELGYLDALYGSDEGRSMFSDAKAVDRIIRSNQKTPASTCLVMIDYGKYPAERLPQSFQTGIDGIRLCFHKKDAQNAVLLGQEILDKGYRLLLQPMVCTRYTDKEFADLIGFAQEKLHGLEAFYLVDSFGSMGQEDVAKRLRLADRCLDDGIGLGLHTHNNMRLSLKHAVTAIALGLARKLIIDGTLAGIGKGSGNMQTEAFAAYLNKNCGGTYDLARLYEVARQRISPIKEECPWGYRREFYLSAKHCLTPSYAKLYVGEYHLQPETVDELLALIPDDKKDSFDRTTAERVFNAYMTKGRKVKRYDRSAGCQGI